MPQFATLLTHIPLWAWAVLVAVILLGFSLSRERLMSRARLVIVPAFWVCWGAWGVQNAFGLAVPPLLAWSTGLLASLSLIRWIGWPGQASAQAGAYRVPGSWWPLVLMLGIFAGKVAVGLTLAVNPTLAHATGFAMAFSALFGALSGAFVGRSLNILRPRQGTSCPVFA